VKSQGSLLALGCDTYLKIKFGTLFRPDFYIYIRNECVAVITNYRHVILSHFGTTGPCERTLRVLTGTSQSNDRFRLESGLRTAVLGVYPRVGPVVSVTQVHSSR
jgi:hypothetical protein